MVCGLARHTFFHNSRHEATVNSPTSTVAPTDDARARSNLDVVRRYLASIEAREPFDVIATYFTPDVVQEEYPNRIVPQGATRDLEAMREGSARGRQLGVFFDLRDGKIAAQRNYDCFDPF